MIISYTQALADHEVEIPETINTQALVKDLAKEIRLVEVNEITESFYILQMLMFKCFSYSFCVLMILKNNLFFRISFSKTLAALVLSFLVRHSPKLPSPPLRIQDGPLEKRKGPSPRRLQGVLGPQEPKRRVKRDYLKQKQENSI